VKDWLTSWGGSEQQLLDLLELYPDAPVYTSVYDQERLPQFGQYHIKTMAVPKWLAKGRRFEWLAPLLPAYFNSLQIKADVVISVTSGFAKAAHAVPPGKHISICNTPLRFAWNFAGDNRGRVARLLAPWFRRFDVRSSQSVDLFLANSNTVAKRIRDCYDRDSRVLYPPVHLDEFRQYRRAQKTAGWLVVGRQVSYKKTDIVIEAANRLGISLTVIGTGPELTRLQELAGPTVKFLGFVTEADMHREMSTAEALIFPAFEDFGLVPVEAMAAGLPVIAFGQGGATESVQDGVTGLFFQHQSADSLIEAWRRFQEIKWSAEASRKRAAVFSKEQFISGIQSVIEEIVHAG